MKSEFLRLNARDFFRGLLASLLATCFEAGKFCIDAHGFNLGLTDIKYICVAAASTMLGYLSLNLFTNAKGKLKPDTK